MGKQEQARFCTMKNLQHCANARAWVIHCNSDPVVISQMLEVDGESKHKFNGERAEKSGIEALREMERRGKRSKTLDNCYIIKK
jgi:hypothetical protein